MQLLWPCRLQSNAGVQPLRELPSIEQTSRRSQSGDLYDLNVATGQPDRGQRRVAQKATGLWQDVMQARQKPCGDAKFCCRSLLALLLLGSLASAHIESYKAIQRRWDHKSALSGASKEGVFLVAAVTSPAQSQQRRRWLRRQWAKNVALMQAQLPAGNKDAPHKVVMKFVIGVNDAESTPEELQALKGEDKAWDDILLIHNIKDLDMQPWQDFHKLWHETSATTKKVLYSMQWAVKKYKIFQYFARLGDDSTSGWMSSIGKRLLESFPPAWLSLRTFWAHMGMIQMWGETL